MMSQTTTTATATMGTTSASNAGHRPITLQPIAGTIATDNTATVYIHTIVTGIHVATVIATTATAVPIAQLLLVSTHQLARVLRLAVHGVHQRGRRFDANTVVVVLAVTARAQSSRAQSAEHVPYQFAEAGRIDGVQFVLVAVPHVVIVKGRAWQAYAVGRFVVFHQPVHLQGKMR